MWFDFNPLYSFTCCKASTASPEFIIRAMLTFNIASWMHLAPSCRETCKIWPIWVFLAGAEPCIATALVSKASMWPYEAWKMACPTYPPLKGSVNTSYKLLMAIVFTYRTWLSMSLFFRIAVSITGFKSPKLSSLVVSEGDRGIRAKYADSAYTCKIIRTKKWMCLRWFKIHLFINSHAFSYLNPKNGEYDCKRSGEFHFIVLQRTDDMRTIIMFVTWYGLGLAICFSQHAEKRSHKRKIRRFALWHSNLKK